MANLSADRKHKKMAAETPKKIQAIVDDIGMGVPYKIAAESNGLSEAHLYNLITQGTNDIDAKNDTIQAKMVEDLRNFEKREIKSCLWDIRNSEKSHKGAEWTLERRFWKYFGNQVGVVELGEQMDKMTRMIAAQAKLKGN